MTTLIIAKISTVKSSGRILAAVLALTAIAVADTNAEVEKPKFELRNGERVILLGATFIERAQRFGYIESLLTSRFPDRNIVFRNLGWSGDTVWAESRGIFDPPAKGYARMIKQISELKPTLIMMAYGTNESFAGQAGLQRFLKQLEQLLKDIEPTGARIVLISPHLIEKLPIPFQGTRQSLLQAARSELRNNQIEAAKQKVEQVRQIDIKSRPVLKRNADLKLYSVALQELARKRGFPFVAIFDAVPTPNPDWQNKLFLKDNGIHLNRTGYWYTAVDIASHYLMVVDRPFVILAVDGNSSESTELKVSEFKKVDKGFRFKVTYKRLPVPAPPEIDEEIADWRPGLTFKGLKPGKYSLRIDGKLVATKSAKKWAEYNSILDHAQFAQSEKLRQTIIEKNQLYFYRWRPQNVTYLFLFRKHEQGNNAKAVQEFDKLVADKELEIAKLRKPIPRVYELLRTAK